MCRDSIDLSALMRDNDNLGADSSVWLRPLRYLFEHGKPLPPVRILAFHHNHLGDLPFGAVALTRNNRVIFWPILPKGPGRVTSGSEMGMIDHLTLELPSERMHVTSFDQVGKRIHHIASDLGQGAAWRLQKIDDFGSALWFTMVVRISVLQDQDKVVQRLVKMPTSDAERRTQEFVDYARQFTCVIVPLPPSHENADFVYCAVYFVSNPEHPPTITTKNFLVGDPHLEADGWPEDDLLGVQPMIVTMEDVHFLIATSCPPGRLRQEIAIRFPRRAS